MTQSAEMIADLIRSTFTRSEVPPPGPILVDDLFKENQNHPAGIRAPHAIEAMQLDSTTVDRYDLEDGTFCTLALAPASVSRSYCMLLYAIELASMGPGTHISQAWRIYGDPEGSATDAFAAFLNDFGLDVTVDDTVARFVARMRAKSASTSLRYDEAQNAAGAFQVTQLIKPERDGSAQISWACAVDVDRYNQHVERNRR